MAAERLSRGALAVQALTRLAAGVVLVLAAIFLPAGTVSYWQGWMFMAVLFVPVTVVFAWLITKEPDLLERRMRMKEKRAGQTLVMKLGSVCYLLTFVVPGLDRRFGWSDVPVAIVLAADVLFLVGYALFVRVLRENSFASRVVEVEAGQRVVSTGPYAVVRHPMYVAVLVMFLPAPVALGSWWALIFSLPLVLVLVARIRDEEALLSRELAGYREYAQVVRHRLIPRVW